MKLTVFHAQQAVRTIRATHPHMDRVVARVENRPDVTCRPGCAHCCTILNLVAFGEALVIADELATRLSPVEYTALKFQLSGYIDTHLPRPDPALDRQAHFAKQVPCSMLGEDKRCTVYAVRPLACRFHYAVSEPARCGPSADGKPQMVKYLDLDSYKGMGLADVGRMQPQVPWAIAPLEVVLWWAMLHRQEGSQAFADAHDGPQYPGRNLVGWTEWSLKLRTPVIRLNAQGQPIGESVGTPGITS